MALKGMSECADGRPEDGTMVAAVLRMNFNVESRGAATQPIPTRTLTFFLVAIPSRH
jgi:hypothetical protein